MCAPKFTPIVSIDPSWLILLYVFRPCLTESGACWVCLLALGTLSWGLALPGGWHTEWLLCEFVPEIQTQDLTLVWQASYWVISRGPSLFFSGDFFPQGPFLIGFSCSGFLFLPPLMSRGKKSTLITLRVKMAMEGWRRYCWNRKSGFPIGLRASWKAWPHLP